MATFLDMISLKDKLHLCVFNEFVVIFCLFLMSLLCVHTEKIRVRKEEVGYKDHVKPLSAIEAFCERFDKAVKNSSTSVSIYFTVTWLQ